MIVKKYINLVCQHMMEVKRTHLSQHFLHLALRRVFMSYDWSPENNPEDLTRQKREILSFILGTPINLPLCHRIQSTSVLDMNYFPAKR